MHKLKVYKAGQPLTATGICLTVIHEDDPDPLAGCECKEYEVEHIFEVVDLILEESKFKNVTTFEVSPSVGGAQFSSRNFNVQLIDAATNEMIVEYLEGKIRDDLVPLEVNFPSPNVIRVRHAGQSFFLRRSGYDRSTLPQLRVVVTASGHGISVCLHNAAELLTMLFLTAEGA